MVLPFPPRVGSVLPLFILYRLHEFAGHSLGGGLAAVKHVSRVVLFGAPVPLFLHLC